MAWRKALKHRIVVVLLQLLRAFLLCLPTPVSLFVGELGGRVAGLLTPHLSKLARRQLESSLSLETDDARHLSRRVFGHLGRLGAELLLLPRLRSRLSDRVELSEGSLEVLRAAVEAGGPAAIAVTAHLGNWELLAQRIAHEGFVISAAARANPNPALGRWLVEERRRGGVETLERGRSAFGLRAALRRSGFIAFLVDQDTRVPSVFAPFFGRLAKTPSVPAELAVRHDLPVVLGLIHREGSKHRVVVTRVEHHDLEGGPEARILALTERLNAGIEAGVRAHPEQWVWVHDRWKTPPA